MSAPTAADVAFRDQVLTGIRNLQAILDQSHELPEVQQRLIAERVLRFAVDAEAILRAKP